MDDKRNRQSWLDAGLERLAEEGPEGLSIMAIARHLGVTKGSFYWHFKDLSDYRNALLELWELRYTRQIIERVEGEGGDALTMLRRILSLEAAGAERLGLAMRSWAISDPVVREVAKRVDAARIGHLHARFVELGWRAGDAKTLATFAYHALSGRFVLAAPVPTATQLDLILGLLASPSPPKAKPRTARRKREARHGA